MRRLFPVVLLPLVLALVLAPVAGAWTWPVRGPVLESFSFDRAHPYAAGQHRGIAIGAPSGAPVVAPAGGSVTFAGSVPTSGKTVTIETAGGLAITLTHLGSVAVERDAVVAEGELVGTVGPSGVPELTVPYVHLGIREAANDQGYLDPLSFLPVAAPSVAPPRPVAAPAVPLPVAAVPVPSATSAPAPAAPAPTAPSAVAPAPAPAGLAAAASPVPVAAAAPAAVPAGPAAASASAQAPSSPRAPEPGPVDDALVVAAPSGIDLRGAATRPILRSQTAAPFRGPGAVAPVQPVLPGLRAMSNGGASTRTGSAGAGSTPAGSARIRAVHASAADAIDREVARLRSQPRPQLWAGSGATGAGSLRIATLVLLSLLAAAALGRGLARLARIEPLGAFAPVAFPGAARVRAVRMIMGPHSILEGASPDRLAEEDPRRARLAVRERAASHRARRGIRGAGGRVRPLSPSAGQRRPDGERHRRARDAGDGLRGQERGVAA